MLERKNKYGRPQYKVKWLVTIFWTVGILGNLILWPMACNGVQQSNTPVKIDKPIEVLEFILEEAPVIEVLVPPEIIDRKFVRYEYDFKPIGHITLKATCYERNDGKIEMKGIYGNDDLDLPRQERRIQRHHYTVALNKKMRIFHESLIVAPSKYAGMIKQHKYRFHVPGYNKADMSHPDASYYSVPRDVMSHKNRKTKSGECLYCEESRIDILFTDSDIYATIDERQHYWGSKRLTVEVWEISRWAIYSDGTKEKVE